MKVLFDTNIFLDIQRGTISENEVNEAKRYLEKIHAVACFSPLSLIELGSHFRFEEKIKFDFYHGAFKAIIKLCDIALTDHEAFMSKEVFNYQLHESLRPDETMDFCKLIADATSYDDLIKPKIKSWNGTRSEIKFDAEFLFCLRTNYEKQYLDDMNNHVIPVLVPDFAEKKAAGSFKDRELLKKTQKYIDSYEFEKMIYESQATRFGISLPNPKDIAYHQAAMEKIKAFSFAYKAVLKKIVESGYNFENNKNDYNDINFLSYLTDKEIMFVTNDQKMILKIDNSCHQLKRIKIFKEWLSLYGGV